MKISPGLDEIIKKLDKKNRKQVEIILKKAGEIAENPLYIRTFGHHLIT